MLREEVSTSVESVDGQDTQGKTAMRCRVYLWDLYKKGSGWNARKYQMEQDSSERRGEMGVERKGYFQRHRLRKKEGGSGHMCGAKVRFFQHQCH